ncbi:MULTISPECIES: flavin reductase family protein [Anaeromyxobacter]|uniref:flavin reductase family protein n=1 Tax=Anaeromyxobacter TaxID=161492 RepID=UPI001F58DE67|nr:MULTISPECIES: flavin reductase family protein [unclassified Anaeromyxobacter]
MPTRAEKMPFEEVLKRFPLPVSVVTVGRGGAENALSVSWACPVSFDPPHVLIAVDRQHYSIDFLVSTKNFAVNILKADQRRMAGHFARQSFTGEDKLDAVRTHEGVTGAALFDDALAWLDCELVRTLEVGDHLLCIGRVVDARVLAEGPALLTTDGVQYGKARP